LVKQGERELRKFKHQKGMAGNARHRIPADRNKGEKATKRAFRVATGLCN